MSHKLYTSNYGDCFEKFLLLIMASARKSLSLKPHGRKLEVAGFCNCGLINYRNHFSHKIVRIRTVKRKHMHIPLLSLFAVSVCCLLATGVDRDQRFPLPFAFFSFGKVH